MVNIHYIHTTRNSILDHPMTLGGNSIGFLVSDVSTFLFLTMQWKKKKAQLSFICCRSPDALARQRARGSVPTGRVMIIMGRSGFHMIMP